MVTVLYRLNQKPSVHSLHSYGVQRYDSADYYSPSSCVEVHCVYYQCLFMLCSIDDRYIHNAPHTTEPGCQAIERYIAICNPLRHAQICTVSKTYILIGLIWSLNAIQALPDLFVLLATQPQTFFYSNIFCFRDYVFNNPYMIEKRNVVYIIYLAFVGLTIVYTYIKIMFVAKSTSLDAGKARSTIFLHGIQLLMCLLTFVGPFLGKLLTEMFPMLILEIRLFGNTLE